LKQDVWDLIIEGCDLFGFWRLIFEE